MTSPVCILTPNLTRSAGGVIEAILGQTRGLHSAGRPVRLIGLGQSEDSSQLPHELNAKTVPFHFNRTLGPAPSLLGAICDSDAKVTHLHGLWIRSVSVAARRWKARPGNRLVLAPHGMLEPWALANSRWKKRLALASFEKSTLMAADCLHALNPAELIAIRQIGLQNPVAVIPNGVDLPDLSDTRPSLRGDGRRVLCFLGRLHAKKGIAETLQAWAHVISEKPDLTKKWRITIAGWDDGGHQSELHSLCHSLNLEKHVEFLGPVFGMQKESLLAHSDAFILASYSEGLPMSVLEAWSFCKPVFMTNACNLSEGFEANAAVKITTDPKQIARVLLEHLDTTELRSLGRNGRQLVETNFSWVHVGKKLDRLYRWLEGSGDRPIEVEC